MTTGEREPGAGEAADGADGAAKVGAALWRVAFILVLGTFMATLDATIVTVGIDTLTGAFGAEVGEIHWVTTAYLLAVVAAVPASGWLADRFGGRRVWLTAVLVFVAASVLCALAWSLTSLIVFRVLQGLGGGLLPPTGQALLARIAGPSRTGRLISVVGVIPLLSPVLGPLVGGSILGVADWPWLFYVNVPIGLAAVLLARRYVPVVPPAASGAPFDVRGALLLAPGLAVLVFGLSEISRGQSAVVMSVAIVAGAGLLTAFVLHGLRASREPLIDPRLFTKPPFGTAAFALFLLGAAVFGTMFLLPLYLQTARGLSPWEAGLLLAPQGLGAAVGSIVVSRIINAVAPRRLVFTGIALVIAGTVVFTQLAHGPGEGVMAVSLVARGLGAAMISAPVMNIVYSRMEPARLPRAASALALLNNVGGSIGTAALAVVLQSRLATREPAVAAAFGDTFWWVIGFCVVAALCALRLPGRATPAARDTVTRED